MKKLLSILVSTQTARCKVELLAVTIVLYHRVHNNGDHDVASVPLKANASRLMLKIHRSQMGIIFNCNHKRLAGLPCVV